MRRWDWFRALLRAFAFGGLLGAAAPAAAQVAIDWEAPTGCPSRDAVVAHVTRLLVGSTAARTAQPVAARARVRALEAGFLLELTTDVGGEHGERKLQAPSCSELAAAAAVIVALLVDPAVVSAAPPAAPNAGSGTAVQGTGAPAATSDASAREGAAPSASDAAPRAEPEQEDASEAEPDEDESEPEEEEEEEAATSDASDDEPDDVASEAASGPNTTRVLLRPVLALDLGTLPRLSAGPGLALGVWLRGFTLELSGSYAPRQRTRRDGRTVAELEHAAVALALCHALPPVAWLSPCARLEYGRLWGRGLSVREPEPGGGALVAAELSLRLGVPLAKNLALSVESGLALPLLAPLFTVDGVGEIHEPSGLLVRLRAGVEARL